MFLQYNVSDLAANGTEVSRKSFKSIIQGYCVFPQHGQLCLSNSNHHPDVNGYKNLLHHYLPPVM